MVTNKYKMRTDREEDWSTNVNSDWFRERLTTVEDGKRVPFWVGRFVGDW